MTFGENPVVGSVLVGVVILLVVGFSGFLARQNQKIGRGSDRNSSRDRWPAFPPDNWWP